MSRFTDTVRPTIAVSAELDDRLEMAGQADPTDPFNIVRGAGAVGAPYQRVPQNAAPSDAVRR
jgi:hypothetical protein